MPTLREVQEAFAQSLIGGDDARLAACVVAGGLDAALRLDVHRDTFIGTLTNALRLSFPAVQRLVGAAFFESAARVHIEQAPPRSAWLDEYGAGFPAFLEGYAPAASVAYLAAVARLEWLIEQVRHAPDAAPLDPAVLAALAPGSEGAVAFLPHPAVALLETPWPVDAIRDAVLARDDAAMARVDLSAGPLYLLVRRADGGAEVQRLDRSSFAFVADLHAGLPLQAAIERAPGVDAAGVLAGQLAGGCFAGFRLGAAPTVTREPPGKTRAASAQA